MYSLHLDFKKNSLKIGGQIKGRPTDHLSLNSSVQYEYKEKY